MTEQTEPRNYKKTLNLPKTTFPMKANLVQNEPASQKRWRRLNLYRRVLAERHDEGAAPFIFHDGPPYANGSIHLGHLLNKVLKDLVVRTRLMLGYHCPFVPGWDCHGLPIEHKVMQELGDKAREMQPIQVRRKCKSSAEKFVRLQSQQMQRLLTLADYDEPYLTMDPQYEAAVLEVFAELVKKGLVYRGLKPVHWSIENQTALAEAELEYYDREDTSVYVCFTVNGALDQGDLPAPLRDETPNYDLLIWTTTPWTLPANMAVAVSQFAEYGLYRIGKDKRSVIIACELAEQVLRTSGVEPSDPVCTFKGEYLTYLRYDHPFIFDPNRQWRVVTADYVTLDDGTGLVHTAPGHGTEDYQTALREGLEVYCPVRADGTFDATAPDWLRGKSVWEANDLVVAKLRESGHLFHEEKFTHSYPHDWRGKTPVIFRATEQWFVSVDKPFDDGPALRERALNAVASDASAADVAFFPEWGRNRMRGMLESRPDWCLSRQRAWGLPIPAFYPPEGVEGEPLLTPKSIEAVARTFRENGSDSWFLAPPEDLLQYYNPDEDPDKPSWVTSAIRHPPSAIKSCDIFDVWFESGSSWHACIRQRFGDASVPTDLYLEGSDQHRGWFQLSLLPALGATGRPPFKAVLTHGFMVDKDGRKMSKSLGNTLEVEDLLKNYGADVCRWWVCSLNTDNDIKVDESFFRLAGEEYRKVRNTIRFLLSNLSDFNPTTAPRSATAPGSSIVSGSLTDPNTLDAWALDRLAQLVYRGRQCCERYQFRRLHEMLFHFCNDTLSAVYLAAVKDRLYCDAPDSPRRRRTQTAMYRIASALIRMLAPILPHTADEAWRALHPELPGDASVHLERLPDPDFAEAHADWAHVMAQRDVWLKAIEAARSTRRIDNPLDIGLRVPRDAKLDVFDPVDLADLCGISRFAQAEVDAATVDDLRDEPRCERSWKRDGTVRRRCDGGMLSDRDAAAVGLA